MRKAKVIDMAMEIAQVFEITKPELSPFTVSVHDMPGFRHKKVEIYGCDGTLMYSREVSGTWNNVADALIDSITPGKGGFKNEKN